MLELNLSDANTINTVYSSSSFLLFHDFKLANTTLFRCYLPSGGETLQMKSNNQFLLHSKIPRILNPHNERKDAFQNVDHNLLTKAPLGIFCLLSRPQCLQLANMFREVTTTGHPCFAPKPITLNAKGDSKLPKVVRTIAMLWCECSKPASNPWQT